MLKQKLSKLLTLALGMSISFTAHATSDANDKFKYPFYVGVTGGWGSTTWGNLVPKDPSAALSLSTPVRVNEGGGVWGAYAGYEFLPVFALEMSYMHYPDSNIYFDEYSIYTFKHEGSTEVNSETESVSLVGKFMLIIPHTTLRAYSLAGVADVHRNDNLVNRWRLSPTFGAGFNYNLTPHLMTELGTEFTAGYGQSELNPAEHYIPFLYSVFLRLAYRI